MSLFFPDPTEVEIVDNFVSVLGADLHYLEAGSGSRLILLHGASGNAWSWSKTIASLAKHYYVIAPDHIGFGESDKPLLNYRIDTLVDFLREFYRVLDLKQSILVGHDLGGWIAAALALDCPELVERLVLIDTNPFNTPEDERVKAFHRPVTRKQTLEYLKELFFDGDRFVDWQLAERVFRQQIAVDDGYTVQQLARSVHQNEDVLDERLSKLKIPTLIIQGDSDRFVPSLVGTRLHREIENSQLQIIDKCGHLPHIEQPQALVQSIQAFLSCRGSPKD